MARRVRPIRAWQLAETAPTPQGNAALVDAVLEQHLVQSLGAFPLLLPILERLGLREIVNQHCQPADSEADLAVGVMALVLVSNRLVAPQPLVHVETWLAQTALPALLGFDAGQANDDRLARTLDILAPHLEGVWQELVVRAIVTFDLDLSQLCYDLTSISFFGAYEEAELITYGYSRDHRPDCKQLEVAATVTAVGGAPIDYQTLAGNVADCTTPVANLRRLQRLLALLPTRQPEQPMPLVISDRAMLTLASIAAYEASGVRYLGPLDPGLGHGAVRDLLASVTAEELAAAPLGYRPQRAADDPAWEAYQGVPRQLLLRHPDAERPPLTVHALVVWSPGKARLDAGLRATHLVRLEVALTDLAGKTSRRPYTTKATVERRLAAILARQPARQFVTARVEACADDDAPEAPPRPAPRLGARCRCPRRSSHSGWPLRPGDQRAQFRPRTYARQRQTARCPRKALRPRQRSLGRPSGLPPQTGAHPSIGLLHHGRSLGLRFARTARPPGRLRRFRPHLACPVRRPGGTDPHPPRRLRPPPGHRPRPTTRRHPPHPRLPTRRPLCASPGLITLRNPD